MAGIYGEPDGMFSEARGTFSEARGMFMPDGSKQQDNAIRSGLRDDIPTALNPQPTPVKSPLSPSNMGGPFQDKKGRWVGADMSLSPRLSDPAFSIERLSGRLGML